MFAALVLAAGNLGDRVGRKGVLLAGLVVFGLASVAGGLGNSPGELIAARAVMGLGAALIFPATLSLLTNVFTERGERARAIGLWGASTGVGIAVGPIVGGWLLEHFSWSSVFFALVPIAALAAALVAVGVPTSRDPEAPPADRPGPGRSRPRRWPLLIYTIIEAPQRGWAAASAIAGFALAAVLLRRLHRLGAARPRPDARRRACSETSASAPRARRVTITFFSLMGFIFLITLYFQFLKGYGPLSTGVRLLPVATLSGSRRCSARGSRCAAEPSSWWPADCVSLAAGSPGRRDVERARATRRSPARWSSSARESA